MDVTASNVASSASDQSVSRPPSLPAEEVASLARDVARLGLPELEKVANSMRAGFASDPEGTAQFVKSLSLEMADAGEYEQALELSAYLFGIREIPDIERALLDHWLGADSEFLRKHLTSQAEQLLTDEHHLSLLASVLQHEHASALGDWVTWLQGRPPGDRLRNLLTTKLFLHSTPASARQLTAAIGVDALNPQTLGHIPTVAKNLDPERPEEGLKWLASQSAEPDLKSHALALFLADLSKNQPDAVRRLLNSPDHFPNGDSGNSTPHSLYQETLKITLGYLADIDLRLRSELSQHLTEPQSP